MAGAVHVPWTGSGPLHHAKGCAAVPHAECWYAAWHVEFHALEQKKAGSNQASASDSLDRHFTPSRSTLYPCRFSLDSLNSYLLLVLQCISQSSVSVVDWLCHRTLMV